MRKLFIYCAGGVGREVCDIAVRANDKKSQWDEICFIDDTKEQGWFYDRRVYPYKSFVKLFSSSDAEIVIANGEPSARENISHKILSDGYELANVIDITAVISPAVRIGRGIILYPFVCVSSNADIKNNVLIYNQSTVAHDSMIGKNSVLSIGVTVAGRCRIHENCFIGAGSVIREKVEVGEWSIVSMGSVVYRSVEKNGIYTGNPARLKRENNDRIVFK